MNKNQIKGSIKDAAGKLQAKVGDAIDSPEQQAKGHLKQVEGHAQKTVGDAQQMLKDARHKSPG